VTLHHLGGGKELLHLFLGQVWLVPGNREQSANQTRRSGKKQTPAQIE
jgi:hypothetical protein